LHNDALCKPEGRGKRNRTGEVPIMPALSEREPKVCLMRRFSKNKIGRGTLFYFCDSLFLSCRSGELAEPTGDRYVLDAHPGERKREKPERFPRWPSPRERRGTVRTFEPLFTADTLSARLRRAGSGVQPICREDGF